ncbi:MAG: insulinase family protein [Faecousia sp.]
MTERIIQKHHFTLRRVRQIPEMQGSLWELEHEKSGAKLVWLQRKDENMTFAVGFRTIPTDSTGVFHILEHSVLNGSDKYPVKEPFVELLKCSLQTFLNAMTYPDKTVYPVSSRNRQDFHNLMDIYMDAVLHPIAMKDPKIFRQEGWRLEFDESGSPMFQGVVYNEMKGAFSDSGRVLERAMMEHLFPGNCYRHCSGGDPAHIPELTYAQFVSEHSKYYHPSNALMVLDGDVDLDECLSLLDGYLCRYSRQEPVFPIPMQEKRPYREARIEYEISPAEDASEKTIFSFGKLLCGFDDPVTLHAAQLLADYLAGDTEAPLKRAVLDAGLGADMRVALNDGLQQAWFGWQVWNTREDKLPEIKRVIRTTVQDILEKGLDRERLLGCYNSLAFKLLDRDNYGYPRGLVEALSILDSWLYGGDPAQNLSYRRILEQLKERLDSGCLEELMKQMLLDERDGFLAVLVPSPTLGQQRVAQERARVEACWAGLDAARREQVRTQLEELHTWQQTPDSPQALAAIPMLSLEDIPAEPAPLPCTETQREGTAVLLHETGGDLIYLNLYFDASDVSPEQMPVLNLLGSLLGTLETERRTGAQLQTAVRQHIGDLSFGADVFHRDPRHHRTVFSVHSVCLPAYREQAAGLLTEILNTTRFTDTEAVKKMLRQKKTANQQKLISMGNRFAAARVNARQTSAGAARERLSGCESIRWINEQCRKEEISPLLAQMEALCRKLFCRSRLTVSVSTGAEALVPRLISAFPQGGAAPEQGSFPVLEQCREGILIPAGVGYAAKGANLEQFGEKFGGQMYVLSNLLTFEHLWNEVRVKGGAYGTGFRGDSNDDIVATSYRDPTPGKTLGHFDGCAGVVEQLCAGKPELTRYILGAMADADPLLGDAGKVRLAEVRHFKGTTQEDVLRCRGELLHCQAEDLLRLCPALRSVAAENNYCIVAGREQLDGCRELLDHTIENLD